MKRQVIVGYANTLHDPAIAVVEGENVFAEAIERHVQCKRALDIYRLWFSRRPIETGLRAAKIWPVQNADVAVITSWDLETMRNHVPQMKRALELTGLSLGREALDGMMDSPQWDNTVLAQHDGYQAFGGVLPMQLAAMRSSSLAVTQLPWLFENLPLQLFPLPEFVSNSISITQKSIPHHLAHAANGVFTSPFDECVVLVVDGFGDAGGVSIYHFTNGDFVHVHSSDPSLGLLYGKITTLCGFDTWEGEEWKVMGLAAYGEYDARIFEFFRWRIKTEGLSVSVDIPDQDLVVLSGLVGGFRKYGDGDTLRAANLAHNFQLAWEAAMVELCSNIYQLGYSKNLCFSGGCALNSSANGKLIPASGFERLHVPSAPADDGNALGTALYEKYCVRREKWVPKQMSPYLGNPVDIAKLEKILAFGGLKYRKAESDAELCDLVSSILADGKIIGWMQGRAEFGPRALGNRSILGDPRRADMQDLINSRVKFREEYRPLAPSILHEYGDEYFENYQESPYMERALRFREAVRNKVPAVVHKDGTGRLQSVKKEWNPLYYELIQAFFKKTGVPILVNTSLNVMGRPIVHSVEDTLTTFITSGLDYAVMGPYIISK